QGHRSWPQGEGDTMVIGMGLGEEAEREIRARLP
ncbi:MAG: hypothetical protein RIS85_2169, partial [Pseudomonadota bacterium]